jgi:diguanylate cyclase (GGDEF)-like protein
MKYSLKQFSVSMFMLLLIVMYTLFAIRYFQQREATATIIHESIHNDLSELAYVLSRHIKKEPILTARSLLDRKAANSNFIRAIAVFDDQKLMVSTDQKYSKVLKSIQLHTDTKDNIYDRLIQNEGIEESVYYYQGKQFKHYSLIFYIDKQYIKNHFEKNKKTFILLFLFIPLGVLIIFALIIRKVITLPLERLRQYAYYQSTIPKAFCLKDIEYIRASMVQTFKRLDQEKTDLYNLSRTDSLSGLANRNLLQERVEQIIELSKRSGKEFALLFLDLDHFKSVNDSLGHDVGDELLRNVAHVIQDILRLNDVVARIGGDEFVIVLTSYSNEVELVEIIDRIQKRLARPWEVQTFPIQITSSIGITIYPKDGENLLTLMKNADIAMYKAKENGRSGYSFFTQELNEKTQEYISLTNSMREALKNDEYILYYQPQNDIKTNEVIGAEALIRWDVPHKGMISPATFIPIAEQNGFIVELGEWVLRTAIKQKKEWEEQGSDIKLSINIAAKQMQNPKFISMLADLLHTYKVNASNIVLEITEYVFLDSNESLHDVFTQIKKLGVKISLDAFGTGYSSLSYLKAFPIDILKIDKSFIDDYENEDGSVFIETIIKMAQTLKLQVIAEGVETHEQVTYLKALHCDAYQGYFCSKPVQPQLFEMLCKEVSL